MQTYTQAHIFTHKHTYTNTHVYVPICKYICTHTCMYVHKQTHIQTPLHTTDQKRTGQQQRVGEEMPGSWASQPPVHASDFHITIHALCFGRASRKRRGFTVNSSVNVTNTPSSFTRNYLMEFPFSQRGCRSERPLPPRFLLTPYSGHHWPPDARLCQCPLRFLSVFTCLPLEGRRDVLTEKAAVLGFNLENRGNEV